MTNRANIFYDHEIEELVRQRSVETLPMILYMFSQYPHGTVEDIFYTIELHIMEHGLKTYPEALLSVPVQEEAVEEVQELDVVEDLEVEFTPAPEEIPVEETEAEPVRRVIQRRKVEDKNPHEKLNLRGIMDDLKELDL